MGIPDLTPWTLSIFQPQLPNPSRYKASVSPSTRRNGAVPALTGGRSELYEEFGEREYAELSFLVEEVRAPIKHRVLEVSSKGNVSATFSVPGLMSVPSDGVGHMVTIVKLELAATMEWVAVPKVQAKVHLKVRSPVNASLFHSLKF